MIQSIETELIARNEYVILSPHGVSSRPDDALGSSVVVIPIIMYQEMCRSATPYPESGAPKRNHVAVLVHSRDFYLYQTKGSLLQVSNSWLCNWVA